MRVQPQDVIDATERDVGGIEFRDSRLGIVRGEPRSDEAIRLGPVSMRAGEVAKRGSVPHSGRSNTFVQSARHSRSFWMLMRIGTSSRVVKTP